jgi:hypothetical protein
MSRRRTAVRARAKFYCDFCGAEVSLAAQSCPQCGRPFSSVRCPRCGYAGPPRAFVSGCPACGYAAAVEEAGSGGNPREERRDYASAAPRPVLPRGFYTITAAVLAVLVVVSVLILFLRLSR